MNWKSVLLAAVASLLTAAVVSQAQVPGVNSTLQTVFTLAYDNSTMKKTYSATQQLVPASAATDVCALWGSATQRLRVRRVIFGGLNNAIVSEPVAILKRSTVYAAAGAAMTMVPYDSNFAAATGTAEYFTANPTTLGTLVGILADVYYTYGNLTTGVGHPTLEYKFGELGSPVVLRGVAQTIAVNLNAFTFTGGQITCTFEWTEDTDT